MKWKDVLLVILLIGAVVGVFLGFRAKAEIKRLEIHADSIATYWSKRHAVVTQISKIRGDSLRKLTQVANTKVEEADTAAATGKQLTNLLKSNKTAADSIKTLVKRDDARLVEISSLRSRIYVDSLRILNITNDRDDWKSEADSLKDAMLAINTDVKAIANVSRHRVNFGIFTIPTEIVVGVGALGVGYVLRAATTEER